MYASQIGKYFYAFEVKRLSIYNGYVKKLSIFEQSKQKLNLLSYIIFKDLSFVGEYSLLHHIPNQFLCNIISWCICIFNICMSVQLHIGIISRTALLLALVNYSWCFFYNQIIILNDIIVIFMAKVSKCYKIIYIFFIVII